MGINRMAFEKLTFNQLSELEMKQQSTSFYERIIERRTVRHFANKTVPIEIIKRAIQSASSAPSGANKQPWHFVIVRDLVVKKKIRVAAEKEEKAFYNYRAPKEWLRDLNQFQTDWHKPFLETAPYLIVVFKLNYELDGDKQKKNYYVNESVGIASGILLTALHFSGLATLTHTPAPMDFLEKILNRPKNEKAVLLIPVGYPADIARVPVLVKKEIDAVCTIV
tara:strand:+ start:505 stop:1173 length:669 start_codon:yes stop_codon:yes gene_type:complete